MNTTEALTTLRTFLRANGKSDGAFEAMDALRDLEAAVLDVEGARAREAAFSVAIVDAQAHINAAYKNTNVSLGGASGYKVAETEQILTLCREQMIQFGLALEVGDTRIITSEGAPFLRIGFGLRHRDGFVRNTSRDFPLSGRGDPAQILRQSSTSALGYFLRDAFALPRLKDEGEAAATAPRSGPRRAETVRQAARQPAPEGAPAVNLTTKEQAVRDRILAATATQLDAAESHLADARSALGEESAPYSEPALRVLEAAARERRAALEANRGA